MTHGDLNNPLAIQRPLLWITGASSGIGWYTALEAGRRGYRLALTARRRDRLEQLKAGIVAVGGQDGDILVAPADVTQLDQLRDAYAQICESFKQVDILLANAGGNASSTSAAFNVAEYKTLFDLNLFGVLNCIEVVLPQMRSRRGGHIVGVSSVAGYRALPTAAAYGATKAALTYFLESLRFDLEREGIFVSVVSPGFVRTPLTDKNDFPMPCLIEPDAAARAIMDGIERRAYEIHFPKRFTLFLKLLGFLPKRIYHRLVARSTIR